MDHCLTQPIQLNGSSGIIMTFRNGLDSLLRPAIAYRWEQQLLKPPPVDSNAG
jgi:hypothetical protein